MLGFRWAASASRSSLSPPPPWHPATPSYPAVFCAGDFLISDCLGVPDPKNILQEFGLGYAGVSVVRDRDVISLRDESDICLWN